MSSLEPKSCLIPYVSGEYEIYHIHTYIQCVALSHGSEHAQYANTGLSLSLV